MSAPYILTIILPGNSYSIAQAIPRLPTRKAFGRYCASLIRETAQRLGVSPYALSYDVRAV